GAVADSRKVPPLISRGEVVIPVLARVGLDWPQLSLRRGLFNQLCDWRTWRLISTAPATTCEIDLLNNPAQTERGCGSLLLLYLRTEGQTVLSLFNQTPRRSDP